MLSRKSIHAVAALVRNSLRIESDQFRSDLSHRDAVGLFQRRVELLEIETTSYCNRTCSFCPNAFIDRLSEKKIMPDAVWQTILDGLREVRYDSAIVWSGYSEALSERRILQRIREVRKAAPKSHIVVNSNGDFLDADYLRELEDSGLDRLWVDLYLPDDEKYDFEIAMKYHKAFLARVQRQSRLVASSPEIVHRIDSPKMEVVTHIRNLFVLKAMDLSDRGGLIQTARKTFRNAPCYSPYKHLVINWDGSVVVCCELRSDSPEHREAVVGKIGYDGVDLVNAYVRLADWRASLRTFGPKKGPCATCNVDEYESTPTMEMLSRFLTDSDSAAVGLIKSSLKPITRKRHQLKR